MQVPTTKRQFYDTTKKVNSVAAYAGAVKNGMEAWGQLFDQQQKARMASLQTDVEEEVKNEFARKSPEYDNDPDNQEFKQYMDDFKKQKYDEAREKVNPFYRGQFDELTREYDKRYTVAYDGWRDQQHRANASNDVKKLAQSMIDEAYIAGQTGAIEDARAKYNQNVAVIRGISTSTLGARATEQGIADLNQQYLVAYSKGEIESDPFSAEKRLNDKNFIKEVGAENVEKLRNYAKAEQNKVKKTFVQTTIAQFNANPTKETLEAIKNQDLIKVSDKTIAQMEETYKASPNYICETDEEALAQVIEKFNDFVSKDYTIKEGDNKGAVDLGKQYADATELSHFIMMQNSKDGKLSDSDRSKYMESVAKVLRDTTMKNAMMNTQSEFRAFLHTVNQVANPVKTMLSDALSGDDKLRTVSSTDRNILKAQVTQLITSAMERLEAGDEDGARKYFETGKRLVIDFKNPEIRGKKVGDTFSKDGQTYQIMGFDDNDVNVRIIYN